MKAQKDIKSIVEEITINYSVDEAILKLNGYFKQYFWNNYLRIQMGELYLKKSDFVQAGKMFYFKQNRNELEERAVKKFVEKCKNNHLTIFNSIVNQSKIPRGIDVNMSSKIFDLIWKITIQEGALPKEIVGWIYSYERIRNIEIQKRWIQNYSIGNDTIDNNIHDDHVG